MKYLSRRGFLIAAGMAVTPLAALPATPGCTLASEQEEGPYYINEETLRRDITENRPGVPLILAVRLMDAKACVPLSGAAFDIWQCDALGVYSGFTADGPGRGRGLGRGGPPPSRQTDASRFLRGVQVSDDRGLVEFLSVYPGWYSGRAIHIHGKVHTGGHVAHTGQFFFPEDLTERISHLEPYAKRLEVPRTTQEEDHVFNDQHGAGCMVNIERLGKSDKDGFRATVTLAVDVNATPAPVGGFGGRGPDGPPPPRRFRT